MINIVNIDSRIADKLKEAMCELNTIFECILLSNDSNYIILQSSIFLNNILELCKLYFIFKHDENYIGGVCSYRHNGKKLQLRTAISYVLENLSINAETKEDFLNKSIILRNICVHNPLFIYKNISDDIEFIQDYCTVLSELYTLLCNSQHIAEIPCMVTTLCYHIRKTPATLYSVQNNLKATHMNTMKTYNAYDILNKITNYNQVIINTNVSSNYINSFIQHNYLSEEGVINNVDDVTDIVNDSISAVEPSNNLYNSNNLNDSDPNNNLNDGKQNSITTDINQLKGISFE